MKEPYGKGLALAATAAKGLFHCNKLDHLLFSALARNRMREASYMPST